MFLCVGHGVHALLCCAVPDKLDVLLHAELVFEARWRFGGGLLGGLFLELFQSCSIFGDPCECFFCFPALQ